MFAGRLEATTRCVECETRTSRQEDFVDVSLSVSREQRRSSQTIGSSSQSSSPDDWQPGREEHVARHSLAWCFDHFTKPRLLLSGEDKYSCEVCRRSCEANTTHQFVELPSTLVVHLKRFTARWPSNWPGPCIQKLQGNIATPLKLTFAPWCNKSCRYRDCVYELCGVVMHCGSRSNTGHYTAYVRPPPGQRAPVFQKSTMATKGNDGNKENDDIAGEECAELSDLSSKELPSSGGDVQTEGCQTFVVTGQHDVKWLHFDDSCVQLVSEAEIVLALSPLSASASSPYMLIYQMSSSHEMKDKH